MTTSYERTLLRLKTLLAAQNAVHEAVQSAIEDVIEAAARESNRPCRPPSESGTLRRFDGSPPSSVDPRAADVEHLVVLAWTNARDDEERNRVRALLRETVAKRLLSPDAETRLLSLAG